MYINIIHHKKIHQKIPYTTLILNITLKHGIHDVTILLLMPKPSHVVICNM